MTMLEETGEHPVRKRCPVCGSGPLLLAWRPPAKLPGTPRRRNPAPTASSPLDEATWWPMQAVLDARLTCGACGNLSYGQLVAGHVTDDGLVDGHFVVTGARTPVEAW